MLKLIEVGSMFNSFSVRLHRFCIIKIKTLFRKIYIYINLESLQLTFFIRFFGCTTLKNNFLENNRSCFNGTLYFSFTQRRFVLYDTNNKIGAKEKNRRKREKEKVKMPSIALHEMENNRWNGAHSTSLTWLLYIYIFEYPPYPIRSSNTMNESEKRNGEFFVFFIHLKKVFLSFISHIYLYVCTMHNEHSHRVYTFLWNFVAKL